MAYNHTEIRKFLGLMLQPNSFEIPEGSLEICDNCVISQDNIITKRRGFYDFLVPAGADVLNNLELYQNTLMALNNDKMQWVNSAGVATTLTGETVDEVGRTGRFSQQNDNLYFTSNLGVMKIEAFNSQVFKSGVPPALDLRGHFNAANGPAAGDAQTAWRVVFGRRDANKNLLLSTPSDILVLTNALVEDAAAVEAATTVTVTTSIAHNLSTGMTINVSGAVDGANAAVTGVDGERIVTVTSPTTFTFTSAGTAPTLAKLTFGVAREAVLEFTVPSEINSTDYFYQIYRTSGSNSANAAPIADFKLVAEAQLTALELASHVVFFTDDVLDIFLGAELYTNPNSREGELQANERPPLCDDITIFKNMMFYGRCTSRHLLNLALVSTSPTLINDGDYIEVKVNATTRRYVARTGVGNSTVTAEAVAGAGTITITYTAHGLVNGDTVFVSGITGTLVEGSYVISGVAANTFQITPGGGQTATALNFEGVSNAGGFYIFQLLPPTLSVAQGLDSTARGLVRAIDRDTGSLVYAKYTSSINDVPGKMLFQAKGFTGPISVRANTIAVGTAFAPELPDSFASGPQVVSENDDLKNVFFVSKIGEPEAVPLVNNYAVGSRNQPILRIIALRDSIIVLKGDGIFVVNGDSPENLAITALDNTIFCLVADSAKLLNNEVFFLSNQGVCKTSSNSVAVISRKIETPLTAILGLSTLAAETSAAAYESERFYLLSTISPLQTTKTVTYCYNYLTDAWTTWDELFDQGTVGPLDKLFLITMTNKLKKERKEQNRIDYCGQDYPVTSVDTVAVDGLTASITIVGVTPKVGDVIIKGNIVNRIDAVTGAAPSFNLMFVQSSNLKVGDAPTLYQKYDSTIKLAPYHAGQVNRSKHFGQFQIHTRDQAISILTISFANDTFAQSEPVEWSFANIIDNAGWGDAPWGIFPWGQEQSIDLNYSTQPAPIIRTYVPRFAARSTFIQPILIHSMAAEPLLIQSMGFQSRGLNERVSR